MAIGCQALIFLLSLKACLNRQENLVLTTIIGEINRRPAYNATWVIPKSMLSPIAGRFYEKEDSHQQEKVVCRSWYSP